MTATLDDVTKKKPEPSAEQLAAIELVRLAKEQGLSLTGPDGLLKQLTKTVLETALDEEMTEHLGYEKHDPAGAGTGNIRNGTRPKTVLTDATGQVEIEVPRDRAGTFEPQIVQKRQRRLNGCRRGGAVAVCQGADHRGDQRALRRDLRRLGLARRRSAGSPTRCIEEMQDWVARPLEAVYAAIFIDAIVVKVRDGQVAQPARSTPRSGSPWPANATSSGCGPAPVVRARSSGWPC